MHVQLTINGKPRDLDLAPNTLLVQAQGAHDFGNADTRIDRVLSLAATERLAKLFA